MFPLFIDNFLNRITMYRLVLYYLIVLVVAGGVFGFFGLLFVDPAQLAFSTVLILTACWLSNELFARAFHAAANVESVYITGLILTLIISPVAANDYLGVGFLIFASVWGSASKYIFAIGKKHIFNPAAFAVAFSALVLGHSASWWVAGNNMLLPLILVGGILVVRKLRRADLFWAFTIISLVTIVETSHAKDAYTVVLRTLQHSSFFFLAFVMLTEPLTMPPDRLKRIAYGCIVGFFFAPHVHIGTFYFTPEQALLMGNIFSFVVNPTRRYVLTLVARNKLATDTFEFVFAPDSLPKFLPGQYFEWTLPHPNPDNRGNRRYFTVASSPTELNMNLGVKFYEPMSSFKRALSFMQPGDTIWASQLAGDFTLPKNKKRKLVFIAGGIGVTPFRSMAQYMLETKDARDAVLLYSNKTVAEIAYKELFDKASAELGMKVVYAVTAEKVPSAGMYMGQLDAALIAREIPDYKERTFYVSGPHGMVVAFKKTLRQMGVPLWRIRADYFPGFA